MAGDEKKIEKILKHISLNLKNYEKNLDDLKNESDEKKCKKIQNEIETRKIIITKDGEKLGELNVSLDEYRDSLNETQRKFLDEIFPHGVSSEDIGDQRNKNEVVRRWKRELKELAELEEKYPSYDNSLSVKEKLNNKRYKKEKSIGYSLLLQGDPESKVYNETWNYVSDLESCKELTPEEKEMLYHCIEVGKEYQVYWLKKFAFIDKIAEKVTGEKQYTAKEVAEITYKKIIPGYLEECFEKDSLTEDEIKNKSRELTRGIYDILVDEKRRTQLMAERDRIIEEKFKPQMKDMGIVGKIAFNKKEEIAIIFFLVLEELGPEEAIYAQMCYDGRNSDVESMKKALETFSLEEILQQ